MKKFFRNTITSLVLLIFCFTTNGFSMIEHYCSSEHESYFFFFHTHPTCESHEHNKPCCDDAHNKHNCCQNSSTFIKLVADYLSSSAGSELTAPAFLAENPVEMPDISSAHCCDHAFCTHSLEPLWRQGQSIVIQNEQFLL